MQLDFLLIRILGKLKALGAATMLATGGMLWCAFPAFAADSPTDAPPKRTSNAKLVSPPGMEIKIDVHNDEGGKLWAHHEMSAGESGAWSVLSSDGNGDLYQAVVTCAVTDSVTLGTALTPEKVASGQSVLLTAYLYDAEQFDVTNFEDLPKTVKCGKHEVHAFVKLPDGTLEAIELRDDGKNGDKVAGDGFYEAVYTPSVQGDVELPVVVIFVRDEKIQLSRELTLLTTGAAASQLLSLSDPAHTTDKNGSYEKVSVGVTANLSQAGEYFIKADFWDKDGRYLTAQRSSVIVAERAGTHKFAVDIGRDFMLRHKNSLPLTLRTALLYFVVQGTETVVASKEFNKKFPYKDASAFEEKNCSSKECMALK